MTLKSLRNPAAKAVAIIGKNAQAVARPVVKLGRMIWRGLEIPTDSRENFRETVHRRATAPFHFTLPALRGGRA